MKKIHFLRTTLFGGLVFLVPFIVLVVILSKAVRLMHAIAKPIGKFVPLETFGGIAIVDIIALLVIILLCFVAGLLARSYPGKAVFRVADNTLMALMPGYALMKERVMIHIADSSEINMLKPVLVTFDDHRLIAFEVERDASQHAVVFLPGAPDPWSGSTVIVEQSRVEPLDANNNKSIVESLKKMGIGTLSLASS